MGILEKLNEKQKEAASIVEGPLLILAGAGSGKTRTVTFRIAHMVNELGIKPYNILAVTFTNKAAREMKERVESLVGDLANEITISTFHSFGVKLLRIYGTNIGLSRNFVIYDSDDQKKLVSSICKSNNIKVGDLTPAKIVGKISRLKEEGILPDEFEKFAQTTIKKSLLEVYKLYQKNLLNNSCVDFTDILLYTDKLLEDKEILEKIQNRYKYVMVDEYQDTNKIQYNMIKKISSKLNNICVVGDEDQSIYGFRGADIRNILNFEKDYKDTRVIKLERNYRSTSNILKAANSVIKNNYTSKGKKLYTDKEDGDKIRVYESDSGVEEASYIGREIIKLTKNGIDKRDITILYRTNSQSRYFEEEFRKVNITHKIFGGLQFYQRKEIKDIIAYLNAVVNPKDNLSLKRIINIPSRGIGAKTIEKLERFASSRNLSIVESLDYVPEMLEISTKIRSKLIKLNVLFKKLEDLANEGSIVECFDEVIEGSGYKEMLEESNETDRLQNIYELRNSMVELESNEEITSLSLYLENISLSSASDGINEDEDYVKLMTIHNSKGLEFKIVFLVGMEEELFPGSKVNKSDDDLEEERRLCYVAITRAKEKLYLTYAKNRTIYGTASYMREPSRFIGEIDEEFLKYDSVHMQSKGYKNTSVKNIADLKREIALNKTKCMSNSKYNIGDYVHHNKFGEGRVRNIEKDRILIYFPGFGEKKFLTSIVTKILVKV